MAVYLENCDVVLHHQHRFRYFIPLGACARNAADAYTLRRTEGRRQRDEAQKGMAPARKDLTQPAARSSLLGRSKLHQTQRL